MNPIRLVFVFGVLTLTPVSGAEKKLPKKPAAPEPAAYCRTVPERKDDIAWENDLVAFRVSGSQQRSSSEGSGIDCWPKRVPSPIINRWYAEKMGIAHDKEHTEGFDFYHFGNSRGCGGTALWQDGKMVLSNPYRTWTIISPGNSKCEFELIYEYPASFGRSPIRELKRISLEMGKRFFRSESTFTRGGKPLADLPVAIGVTTHDGKAAGAFSAENRWIACWEKAEGESIGTGAILAPGQPFEAREIKSAKPDQSQMVILTKTDARGVEVHYAGFAWAKASPITSEKEWAAALDAFSKKEARK